jgi:hypothetical protein
VNKWNFQLRKKTGRLHPFGPEQWRRSLVGDARRMLPSTTKLRTKGVTFEVRITQFGPILLII